MQNLPVQGSPIYVPTDILTQSPDRLQAQLRAADGAESAGRDVELKKASQEFESIFVAYLLKVMRETIDESGLTEGGFGKGIYTELFDQEVSRVISRHGALGMGELIYRHLSAPETKTEGAESPKEDSKPVSQAFPAPPEMDPEQRESVIPDYRLPLQAPVSSAFGIRKDPISRHLRFHKGIDLAAPAGTEVRAAQRGTVLYAGYEHGYGNSVVIQHPEGFQTRYAHLGVIDVKAGDTVAAEQVLGVVGSTGRSTGAHLHFEVIRNGEQVNPGAAVAE